MAAVKFELKPTLKNFTDRYEKQIANLKNMKTAYKKASIYLDRWVQQNFRTEGGNVGGWQEFAFGGRITDSGVDTSAKLLQDSGRLRASFLPWATASNAGIGSDLPYSDDHQKGLGRTPMRRLIPKAEEVEDPLREIFEDHVRVSFK